MELKDYLKINHKTHLIFDFDDTLFNLLLPWKDREKCLMFAKKKLIQLDARLYEKYQDNELSLTEVQNEYVRKFAKKAKKITYSNGVKFESFFFKGVTTNDKLINFVKNNQKYKLFMWSSNTRPTITKFLKEYKIINKFKKIITSKEVVLMKPYIDGFKLVYNPKVNKNNYLMIGNSNEDRQAAKNSGIDFFLVDVLNQEK